MDTKRVYNVEYIELLDGKQMVAKPFSIKKNRIAKEKLNAILDPEVVKDEEGEPVLDEEGNPTPVLSDEEAEAILLDVTAMAMEGQEKLASLLEDRDNLEEALDLETMYEIIKVATGYDFLEMQERMKRTQQQLADAQMAQLLRNLSN